jgi:O-antigen/teichoic acid export membrane protein
MGWQSDGRLLGIFIATALMGAVNLYLLFNRGFININFSSSFLKDALKFGIPLLPHTLSNWIRTFIDRFILTYYGGISIVGVYTVGYQVAGVLLVLGLAFNRSFSIRSYQMLKQGGRENKINLVKFTYLYIVIVTIVSALFIACVELFFEFIFPTNYIEAKSISKYLICAFSFNCMYYAVANIAMFHKKTLALSKISITSAIIHMLLSWAFISQNGMLGAGQASIISMGIMFVMTWWLSNDVEKLPWFSIKISKGVL